MLFICKSAKIQISRQTMNPALTQFKKEIVNFYVVSLLNIIFAALAIAFGVQYIVLAVLGNSADPALFWLRILTGAVAMASFGLGLSWLLSSIGVFEGLDSIKDILCTNGDTLSDERTTCLIVRMLAHYRDKRETIRTMILVCTLGGCAFFILGIATGLEGLKLTGSGIEFTLNILLLIPAMVLTLGIALVSLLSSYYFSKFSRVWDQRLHEIDESECTLKKTLGLDES
jgi:hypothetical protein